MYLVAYDGSEYAKGALLRAVEYADLKEIDVEAFSAIPDSVKYARDRQWISTDGEYDFDEIVQSLHEQVTTLAPRATFNYRKLPQRATAGKIASEIKDRALTQEAEIVFLGSEEAGTAVTSVTNVESTVAGETQYDVHIVRTPPRNMADLDKEKRKGTSQQTAGDEKPSWGADTLSDTSSSDSSSSKN